MPQVPIRNRREQRADPTPFQSGAGASADAFGAGVAQATQGLGQSIGQAANVFSEIALKQQIDQNETKAKQMDVSFTNQKRQLLSDYYKLKGTNATDATPKLQKDLNELRERINSGTENTEVQRMFGLTADSRLDSDRNRVAGYHQEQVNIASVTASLARMAEANDDAIVSGGDKAIIEQSTAIIRAEVAAISERDGLMPEVSNRLMDDSMTAMHSGVITSMVKNDNIAGATSYLAKYGREMDGAVRASMNKLVSDGKEVSAAQASIDELDGSPKTFTEKIAEARKKHGPDDPIRKDVVIGLQRREKERTDAKAASDNAIADKASVYLNLGGTLASMRRQEPEMWQVVLGDTALKIRLEALEVNLIEGNTYPKTSKPGVMLTLSRVPQKELALWSEEKINSFTSVLKKSDHESVVDMQRIARIKMSDREREAVIAKIKKDAADDKDALEAAEKKRADLVKSTGDKARFITGDQEMSTAARQRGVTWLNDDSPTDRERDLMVLGDKEMSLWIEAREKLVRKKEAVPYTVEEIREKAEKFMVAVDHIGSPDIGDYQNVARAVELLRLTPEQRAEFQVNMAEIIPDTIARVTDGFKREMEKAIHFGKGNVPAFTLTTTEVKAILDSEIRLDKADSKKIFLGIANRLKKNR